MLAARLAESARHVESVQNAEIVESVVARAHHRLAATMMTGTETPIEVTETGASAAIGTGLAAQTTATAR